MKKVTIGEATLYHGDCLHMLADIDPVDGVITDPPYSSGGMTRGDRMGSTKAKYLTNDSGNQQRLSDFSGDNRDQRSFEFWSVLWCSAAMQATVQGGAACFFTDWRQLPISTDYMQAGGWVWRGLVPWAKRSHRPQIGRFGAQCEYVVWGSNGPMPTDRGVGCLPGFFDHSTPTNREHVTQKPVPLMAEIVAIVPVDRAVLDPFMGSGTTGIAAIQTGRRFVGCEINPEIFEIACQRIEAAAQQRDMYGYQAAPTAEQAGLFQGAPAGGAAHPKRATTPRLGGTGSGG